MFFSYTTRNINTISLIITILVVGAIKGIVPVQAYTMQNQVKIAEEIVFNNWKIEIPEIGLVANIANGTDEETMNKYVGHFEETNFIKGNVGLAAHNRGYPVNYFKDLHKLETGDKILYSYNGKTLTYVIDKIKVIKDTNWEPLKNTNENRITLITCIANEPEYRLCVQGIEIGGNNENKENINYIINNDYANK